MKRDLKKAFGKVIKELRTDQGLSQQALADYSEVSRAYISDLERGLYYPTLNVVFKIAEILKVKPSELVRRVDEGMR